MDSATRSPLDRLAQKKGRALLTDRPRLTGVSTIAGAFSPPLTGRTKRRYAESQRLELSEQLFGVLCVVMVEVLNQ